MLAKPLHICLIAGEPSGDALGASLIHALRQQRPDVIISGVGGPKMTDEGLQSLFPIDVLAVMGITEILPRLKTILGKINDTADYIEQSRPDIVVSIDSPDFCFRVMKKVRKDMRADAPKLIHYVAPTVWAWRAGRAKKIARFLDGLICLFDFEPRYFDAVGLRAVAVGHPVVETAAMNADGTAFRARHGIATSTPTLGVFFGSRRGELHRHGEIFRDVMTQLPPNTHFIIPTLSHLEGDLRELLSGFESRLTLTTDRAEKWQAFAACDTALAVSGTVALELAAAHVPHVIAYRISASTYQIAKRLVKVRFAHLLNIMLDKPIVPEFIQTDCHTSLIAPALATLMADPEARAEQMTAFDEFTVRIGANDETPPSQKAAQFILSFAA
jgi:lipid-A-disaccharide synthase